MAAGTSADANTIRPDTRTSALLRGVPVPVTGGLGRRLAQMFGLDLRSLALFRICLGLLLVADVLKRLPWIHAHYSDAGILPRSEIDTGYFLSIHMLSGEVWFQSLLLGVALVLGVLVLVGWQTRLALLGSWFLLTSLQARNPYILQGGDLLFRLLVFWAMFLPLGALWAVDARRSGDGKRPLDPLVISGGTVAYVLQVCFLYWCATVMKFHPVWYEEHTALWYSLNLDHFATIPGRWLLEHRWLHAPLTVATLLLEGAGPAILLMPVWNGFFRTLIVVSFLLFHIGLGLCLDLGPFPWVCGATWLVLLPGCVWESRPLRWLCGWFRQRVADGGQAVSQPAWWVHAVAACLLGYVMLVNLRGMWPATFAPHWPAWAFRFGDVFAINQSWAMFSPYPLRDDGWYIARATLEDGEEVDVLRGGQSVNWDKPEWVSATYPSEHWRKYLMNLIVGGLEHNRRLYAQFLCREWNACHPEGKRIRRIDILYMVEHTMPDRVLPPRPLLLCREYCLAPNGEPSGQP